MKHSKHVTISIIVEAISEAGISKYLTEDIWAEAYAQLTHPVERYIAGFKESALKSSVNSCPECQQ